MKVAIFTNTYPPSVNGVATSVANLREGLSGLGHSVDIFAPALPSVDRALDPEGVYRFPAFMPPRWFTSAEYPIALPFSREIISRLRLADYDVVHAHHPFWVGNWGLWYAKQMKIPFVSTSHTQYEIYSELVVLPSRFVNFWLSKSLRYHYNRSTLVTTPGRGSLERLNSLGLNNVVEVSNATRLERFWNASGERIRAELGIAKDELVVGYVGRVTAEKNICALLDAFRRILNVRPMTRLLIVGGSKAECQALKKEASLRGIPEDRITLTGRVDYSIIERYYGAMDLFLTASSSEVQPMTFAEALGCSLPIVAFDVPGCNDMVKDEENGKLVDLRLGSSGLALAALLLLNSQDYRLAMQRRALEWSRRYDISVAVPEMVRAYERAIAMYQGRHLLAA